MSAVNAVMFQLRKLLTLLLCLILVNTSSTSSVNLLSSPPAIPAKHITQEWAECARYLVCF